MKFIINDYWVIGIFDSETGQELYKAKGTSNPFSKVDKPTNDDIESYMESNKEAIENDVNENPPEPYVPGED